MIADESTHAGANGEDILFSTSSELGQLSVAMAKVARRRLDIVSRRLDPSVYETRDFLETVKKLVISGHVKVRILVLDPASVISLGNHRLVDLAMHVSSHMEIRRPGANHLDFNEAMLIADNMVVIHRKYADRYEGVANFNAPREASIMAESFESIWQHAETIPHFRRLMI